MKPADPCHRIPFVIRLLWILAVLTGPSVSAAQASSDYVLGAGDVLHITVYQSPDLTLDTRVTESGTITYPLLGTVRLGGLSVAQAEAAIARGLHDGQFIKQPQVTVMVTQVRGNQVSALGHVNKPGRYAIDLVGMRLSELLALAGGIAQDGSDVVTLTGERNGQPFRTQVDVPALYGTRPGGEDPVLLNGDVLFVDRAPMVYIYGEVQKPGPVRLERGMNVMKALAAGGGLTARGTQRGVQVHRRDASGKVQAYEAELTSLLRDGDVVYVRESLF
ncbi:MAG TPA: polysaccharide export protein EpsE [Burkholderiaceae bacterium]|nr:polysaccharide export protein EpsE [Burkholderiaceae bacterium]